MNELASIRYTFELEDRVVNLIILALDELEDSDGLHHSDMSWCEAQLEIVMDYRKKVRDAAIELKNFLDNKNRN